MTRKAPMRRLRRSNQSLTLDRSMKAIKAIYWTESRLQKLLSRIIRNDRREWFAARVRALKSWPERTKEQIMADASRINPTPLMNGRWAWPKSQLAIERDLVPPEDGIDADALRAVLAKLDNRQGDRLIELLAEDEFLKEATVPLEYGQPQPKEIGTRLLRRIKRLHKKLMEDIAGDPDGDLAAARRLEIPRANLTSVSGWSSDMGRAFKLRGKYRGE